MSVEPSKNSDIPCLHSIESEAVLSGEERRKFQAIYTNALQSSPTPENREQYLTLVKKEEQHFSRFLGPIAKITSVFLNWYRTGFFESKESMLLRLAGIDQQDVSNLKRTLPGLSRKKCLELQEKIEQARAKIPPEGPTAIRLTFPAGFFLNKIRSNEVNSTTGHKERVLYVTKESAFVDHQRSIIPFGSRYGEQFFYRRTLTRVSYLTDVNTGDSFLCTRTSKENAEKDTAALGELNSQNFLPISHQFSSRISSEEDNPDIATFLLFPQKYNEAHFKGFLSQRTSEYKSLDTLAERPRDSNRQVIPFLTREQSITIMGQLITQIEELNEKQILWQSFDLNYIALYEKDGKPQAYLMDFSYSHFLEKEHLNTSPKEFSKTERNSSHDQSFSFDTSKGSMKMPADVAENVYYLGKMLKKMTKHLKGDQVLPQGYQNLLIDMTKERKERPSIDKVKERYENLAKKA